MAAVAFPVLCHVDARTQAHDSELKLLSPRSLESCLLFSRSHIVDSEELSIQAIEVNSLRSAACSIVERGNMKLHALRSGLEVSTSKTAVPFCTRPSVPRARRQRTSCAASSPASPVTRLEGQGKTLTVVSQESVSTPSAATSSNVLETAKSFLQGELATIFNTGVSDAAPDFNKIGCSLALLLLSVLETLVSSKIDVWPPCCLNRGLTQHAMRTTSSFRTRRSGKTPSGGSSKI